MSLHQLRLRDITIALIILIIMVHITILIAIIHMAIIPMDIIMDIIRIITVIIIIIHTVMVIMATTMVAIIEDMDIGIEDIIDNKLRQYTVDCRVALAQTLKKCLVNKKIIQPAGVVLDTMPVGRI